MQQMQTVKTNGIQLAYQDFPALDNSDRTLVLMHGLSANAHIFDGLIKAGLNRTMRVILPDLRGRGQSDKPDGGYAMHDHATDLVGLLDALGLDEAIIGGHSFGGLVTMYTGANYPDRVQKMVILDSGLLQPNVREIIKSSLDRLGMTYDSFDAYLETIKSAPYFAGGNWHDDMVSYYRADVKELDNGQVTPRANPHAIEEAAVRGLEEDWPALMAQADQPAILLHAAEPFTPGGPSVLKTEDARQTADLLQNCQFKIVPGHHLTMLFGANAGTLVDAITQFVMLNA
ncbi:MAG: alpha/beta fold hydrolase [Chloroflexota bacterium]